MAENLKKIPKRSILKQSTSFEQREHDPSYNPKNPHFDEMNILATLHPPDKDYGFMKIDEPKTPYEYASDNDVLEDEEEDSDNIDGTTRQAEDLDANLLAEKIASEGCKGPRPRKISEPSMDEEDLKLLTPEERERRKSFEIKRKAHYNEFQAVKLARQLMQSEDVDDDESQEAKEGHSADASSSPMDTTSSA